MEEVNQLSLDELKQIFRQYGLIQGNNQLNEMLISRVASILRRECKVERLVPFDLQDGPIDLSTFLSYKSQSESAAVDVIATPMSSRKVPISGSSETAPVAIGTARQTRPAKTHEEQVQEVNAAIHAPAPEVPSEVERVRNKPLDGARAASSQQQHHFQSVIQKVQASIPDSAKRSGALSKAYEELTEGISEEEGDLEVKEEISGQTAAINVEDTDLSEMFSDSIVSSGSPVEKMRAEIELQKALPKKLDSSEPSARGKNKSITRVN